MEPSTSKLNEKSSPKIAREENQGTSLENRNVLGTFPLMVPRQLKSEFPLPAAVAQTVAEGRREIEAILRGEDERFLVIVGPCSIHDPKSAMEYAQRLVRLRREVQDRFCVVMRVYFEKPRTTLGWKGLINDPHLDGSFDIQQGLRLARSLLLQINALGLPTATEMLEPITPQFIDDLVSWAAIGARTTESQTHRQMASGLSMPVGFKNSTEGNLQVAIDAMKAARSPHHFLGIDEEGQTCVVATRGNRYGHVILRGGRNGPNYDEASVDAAASELERSGLDPRLVVDCSHANSGKRYDGQEQVWRALIDQRQRGSRKVIGAMLESHLFEGRQDLTTRDELHYGVSITDGCLGWEKTSELLLEAHQQFARLR